MIRTIRSDELRPGMIMSTNGAKVESVVLCQTVGDPASDEICVCYSFEDPYLQKFEYVEPSRPVHIWADDEPKARR